MLRHKSYWQFRSIIMPEPRMAEEIDSFAQIGQNRRPCAAIHSEGNAEPGQNPADFSLTRKSTEQTRSIFECHSLVGIHVLNDPFGGVGRRGKSDDRLVAEGMAGSRPPCNLRAAIDLTVATGFEPRFGRSARVFRFAGTCMTAYSRRSCGFGHFLILGPIQAMPTPRKTLPWSDAATWTNSRDLGKVIDRCGTGVAPAVTSRVSAYLGHVTGHQSVSHIGVSWPRAGFLCLAHSRK